MIILATPIEQDQQKILKYMHDVEAERGVSVSIKPQRIREGIGLTSYQISTALELLKAKGLVDGLESLFADEANFVSARLTAKGRLKAEKMKLEKKPPPHSKMHSRNPRNVFVVHGRDLKMRDALFEFLRALDLHPLEWTELIKGTGKGAPYVGEILEKAFSEAQAIIVLMTPDDEGCLRIGLRGPEEPLHEKELTPQARLNVVFEAGMAMGYCPERTIIVETSQLRAFSDIAGRHTVRMDNSPQKRQDLALRLEEAGCRSNREGTGWLTAGDFSRKSDETSGIKSELESKHAGRRKFHKVSPKFAHLTILYSQRTDSPDSPNPARPRYVINNLTNQAHRVSTWLEPYIAQHKVNWHTFDGKEALLQYFKDNNVGVHEHDPTPADLNVVLE